MKKVVNSVFVFLTFLSYNSFGQSTATVTQPCHTTKIWVVVSYNLDFNQQFNYSLTWGGYTDSYKSKKSALFNCGGVKLNNYSVGHVFTYNNKGCESNPNKQGLNLTANCTNCTVEFRFKEPTSLINDCKYIKVNRGYNGKNV